MFAIPVFTHMLCAVPHSRIKNIIFGGIAILMYIGHHFFVFVTSNEQLQRLGEYIEAGTFLSVVLYAFVVGLYHYRALQENIRRAIALRVLILLGVFLPGILYETLPNANSSMIFSPLLYCGFSILFTYYLVTHYSSSPKTSEGMMEHGTATMSEEEFFDAYRISPREREIASLLLQGHKNHHIAERLYIAVSTVKTHIRNMYQKFGVTSRYELLILFKNSERTSTSEAGHHDPTE
jgi:DNA-binding CsgD family transcriptional regulator